MKPIRRPNVSKITPSVPVDRSLRMKMRLGQLSQADAEPQLPESPEPCDLFDEMPPATRGTAQEAMMDDERNDE